ncbi:MAG: hypothetical protein LBH17_06275 [Oscillospiraceae bacterium]|nr:hypothetical protein [Oscillospiraceae bacterium]
MKVVYTFDAFNHRRYSNPWVAEVDPKTAKISFARKIGGYTGGYGTGDAGDLYITEPQEGAIYAYGQKDTRKASGSFTQYIVYKDGDFVDVAKTELVAVCNARQEQLNNA